MSTRPRITFNKKGWCNACQWMAEKKILDWGTRNKELDSLLQKHFPPQNPNEIDWVK